MLQYRTIGRIGVRASFLLLGAVNFATIGRSTHKDATSFVDTADRPDAVDSIVAAGVDLAPDEKHTAPAVPDPCLRRR